MNKNSYQTFAYYYNQLIPNEFYEKYAQKIKSYHDFQSILDLACGSGTLCFLLKNEYNEVSGLDLSEEMLMIALEKNIALKKGINFINANMIDDISLKNNYDLITCTLDSLNYLDSLNKVEKVFTNVSSSLQKGGYFLFDVLTQFYIDEIVDDYYQAEKIGEFEYEWQVKKVDDNVIKHNLSIFVDDKFFSEEHYQYIYHEKEIEDILQANKLEIINKEYDYNDLDSSQASRVYYVTRKSE